MMRLRWEGETFPGFKPAFEGLGEAPLVWTGCKSRLSSGRAPRGSPRRVTNELGGRGCCHPGVTDPQRAETPVSSCQTGLRRESKPQLNTPRPPFWHREAGGAAHPGGADAP